MAQAAAPAHAGSAGAPRYARHRPEHTLLYRIVAQHYPAFLELLAGQGRPLPDYVQQEFEAYLKCGRLEHGFLRVRCESCHAEHLVAFSCKRRGFCPSCGARRMAESAALLVDEVFPEQPVRQWVLSVPYPLRFLFASRPEVMGAALGIVYRVIAAHLARKAGFRAKRARTGAVTLIQRFGGALNLNLHFHMLFLDGVYVERPDGTLSFRWVKAPTSAELSALAGRIAGRVGRFLERRGLLERDAQSASLAELALGEEPMQALLAHSITYRIALGPRAGRKVFTLQTLPPGDEGCGAAAGQVGGFSLHAGVAARADERNKLERLCRYISRPAVSQARLSLTPGGHVRYQLKTPYRDGTTHVLFEPLDLLARLAALVPKPRANLTPYRTGRCGMVNLGDEDPGVGHLALGGSVPEHDDDSSTTQLPNAAGQDVNGRLVRAAGEKIRTDAVPIVRKSV